LERIVRSLSWLDGVMSCEWACEKGGVRVEKRTYASAYDLVEVREVKGVLAHEFDVHFNTFGGNFCCLCDPVGD